MGSGFLPCPFSQISCLWEAGTPAPYTTNIRLLNEFLVSVWERKSSQVFADRPGQGLGTSLWETEAEGAPEDERSSHSGSQVAPLLLLEVDSGHWWFLSHLVLVVSDQLSILPLWEFSLSPRDLPSGENVEQWPLPPICSGSRL